MSAATAGTDLDDLLVLNASSEVLSVVRSERRRRGVCTVAAEVGRLGQRGTARAAPVEEVPTDTAGGFSAIAQPPDLSLDPRKRTETVMAVIAAPAAGTLLIAPDRPSVAGFTQVVGVGPAL